MFKKGLLVPNKFLFDSALTTNEKMILAVVGSFDNDCQMRNIDFASVLGLSIGCVQKSLTSLKEKNYTHHDLEKLKHGPGYLRTITLIK